ncbi:hypothetical protein [Streptomyces sp. CBMA123]|uniref:hypothetical protein n=1 Tax=Streptomyces sp. CBMA123 TaxID=1896313 RepID=UPI001D732546|nr:hypothetical protein [Streptomyces sp. CBMA123]MBD0690050.1 hypothetical protein [Streptomyces sp. CBMA123]
MPLPERADAPALRTALGEVRRPRVGRRCGGTRFCLGWTQRLSAGQVVGDGDGDDSDGDVAGLADAPAREGAEELVFHAGSTRGFSAFVGCSPRAQVGLAVLTGARSGVRIARGRGFVQSAYETLRTLAAQRAAATGATGARAATAAGA